MQKSTGVSALIKNLKPGGTVYLLGGELAIPVTVAEELTAAGYTVERLAGGSRFDTNLAILEELTDYYVKKVSPGKDPAGLIIKYIRTGVCEDEETKAKIASLKYIQDELAKMELK